MDGRGPARGLPAKRRSSSPHHQDIKRRRRCLEGDSSDERLAKRCETSAHGQIYQGGVASGIGDLDFGYWQHEELTNRLHSLLKDSYTDGLSVPKELIQNADDAGATEVKFLLDERENADSRKNVLNEMASLQGPALWAFNNATFSDRDFENIVRLGAGTKKEDGTKVGKFGLGFNSVYNLTDVPSFISGHTMAIFDPQVKYLQGPGLRLDFRKPPNRVLLSRMADQFKPFQGVFGCTLKRELEVQYEGALFRFPFRTEAQAADSKIKAEAYSESKRKQFLRMLLVNCGNLLMFTQHVNKLEIYYISSECKNPEKASRLLILKKKSKKTVLFPVRSYMHDSSVLQYAMENWRKGNDVTVKEEMTMHLQISSLAKNVCDVRPENADTDWIMLWTCWTSEREKTDRSERCEQQIPLAAVAVRLQDKCIVPLCKSPVGFYASGHLFCFLPLPMEFVSLDIPVHINGTFELASSRRNLLTTTEDDLSGSGADWNMSLFSDTVCHAYLLLLENLHEEAASEADFKQYFKLWPTTNGRNKLFANFYRHLANGDYKVFPVARNDLWVSFNDANFVDPEFRASDVGHIAWDALNQFWSSDKNLVDAPGDFLQQMKSVKHGYDLNQQIITEQFFYENVFFPNIKSSWWRKESKDRVVLHALLSPDPKIQNLVKNKPCIPCHCTADLKTPRDLIHPDRQLSKLFLPSEGRFPQKSENVKTKNSPLVDFSTAQCLSKLSALGMITDTLEWNIVIERAQSIDHLARSSWSQAMDRATALLDYMAVRKDDRYTYDSCPSHVLDALSNIRFLPVMTKPGDWQLPWQGGCHDKQLASPRHLFSDSLKELVGCKAKILDSKILKTKAKEKGALKKMKLTTKAYARDVNLFDLVTEQLLTVADQFDRNPYLDVDLVYTVCIPVYKHLDKCLFVKSELKQRIQNKLSGKRIIWVKDRFVESSRVSLNSTQDCQPYLFSLSNELFQYQALFGAVGVRDSFEVNDVLMVFKEVFRKHGKKALHGATTSLVSRLAQLLCDVLAEKELDYLEDTRHLYLPDRHGLLQPVRLLCLDDCDWLRESDTMKFVHDKISPAVAKSLGVSSKRQRDFDEMSDEIPFGPHERLTIRIKTLLKSYTFDSSVFKELIQNADDAGATEIKFIKDFRVHKTDRIPPGWEHLQGPSLCVYNNKSFTSEDMEGIKNVGIGSKRHDLLKTGKYGVGFNAVYHITDVPSFWTRENDTDDVICVFDPNCRYLPNISDRSPGKKLTNIRRLQQNYPDMFAGYLGQYIDMNRAGTLFRLPLRTPFMAKTSEIKDVPLEESELNKVLSQFKTEASKCLLFLNNISKIGIYTVDKRGALKTDYEISKTMSKENCEHLEIYKRNLTQFTEVIKLGQTKDLKIIPQTEVCLEMRMKHSKDFAEEWITVSRVGFSDQSKLSPRFLPLLEGFLLPRGGVAVRVSPRGASEREQHSAFCCLPLPVTTGLPVHVNGEFILDHDTRRNIWENTEKDDSETEWNRTIASQVIGPAYATMIQKVRDVLFSKKKPHEASPQEKLKFYESLFPQLESAPSKFWENMMKSVYIELAQQGLDILPVISPDRRNVMWVPAVKDAGFPGYFSDLENYFQKNSFPYKAKAPADTSFQQNATRTVEQGFRKKCGSAQQAQLLTGLLISLNLKIVSMSFCIFQNFTSSGVAVAEVTPDSVTGFLKSSGNGHTDGCNLTGLPKPVERTSLKSPDNVKRLIKFLKKSPNFQLEMKGLPLCLRQSHNLYFFQETSQTNKPLLSEFGHLLPESSDHFMHKALYTHLGPLLDKQKEVMRKLDIVTFAEMLPRTLRVQHYKTGFPCQQDVVKPLPDKDWIKNVWTFFETLVTESNYGDAEARRVVDCLGEWSLIPVEWRLNGAVSGISTETELYPMKNIALVLYLTDVADTTNAHLWEILKLLPLPNLDRSRLPEKTFAFNLAASITNPMALLYALNSLPKIPKICPNKASVVLRYFSNNVSVLKTHCTDENFLKQSLRKLPFFTSIDGNQQEISGYRSVICFACDGDLPSDGLSEWSKATGHLLLLERNVPEQLARYLSFLTVSLTEFYTSHLLLEAHCLPRKSLKTHIEFLKDRLKVLPKGERASLISRLKETPFIEGRDGRLCKANEFYSPHEPVFTEMRPSVPFPPMPYSEKEWKGFMRKVGMICRVPADLFVAFAKRLADGEKGVGHNVEKASMGLVDCLFHRMDLKSGDLLSMVKDIPFLMPSKWTQEATKKVLTEIALPFCPQRLVSFSESCRECHLYLVWSSSAILSSAADPHLLSETDETDKDWIGRQLGFQERAPILKVVQHVENVCRTLAAQEEIYHLLRENDNVVKEIMVQVYEYLTKSSEEIPLPALQTLPIIYHVTANQMMCPDNVVIDITKDDEIDGFLMKAPHEFGNFFDLFKKLGVAESVTADHYARVLQKMKSCTGDKQLHVEEMKKVRQAVEGLFKCLKSTSPKIRCLSLGDLYLPSEEEVLRKSSELIFVDNDLLRVRLSTPPAGKSFFVGFNKLEIKHLTAGNLKQLPERYGMLLLTSFVTETVPQNLTELAVSSQAARMLNDKVSHPMVAEAVARAMFDKYRKKNKPFPDNALEQIAEKLSRISVMEIQGLQTVLIVNGETIAGSNKKKSSFVCKQEHEHRSCIVFIDESVCDLRNETYMKRFTAQMARAMEFVLGFESMWFEHIAEDAQLAMEEMDEHGLFPLNLNGCVPRSVFPDAGTFVPVSHHCYLDNSFYRFKEGEHVGFESYDPCVEMDDPEDTTPIYIYGKILKEAEDKQKEESLLTKKYLVDLGPERGQMEVPATRLYKFIRKSGHSGGLGLAVYGGDADGSEAHGPVHEPSAPQDLKAVLREIRRLLTEASELPDAERRRVEKRLILRWHPDKNPGNEKFCTEVMQALNRYLRILGQGKTLNLEDNEDKGRKRNFRRPAQSTSSSPFFENIYKRGKQHERDYASHQSQSNTQGDDKERPSYSQTFFESAYAAGTSSNPQPGEGRRWFRQAEADLLSARETNGTCKRGYNWVCFQCHQAVEKALKAVLYCRDANFPMSWSHELASLARQVGDKDLSELASMLVSLLGPHTRMRYPDVVLSPSIPADVYNDHHATKAWDLAVRALDKAKALL